MKFNRKISLLILSAVVSLNCGCVNISGRTLDEDIFLPSESTPDDTSAPHTTTFEEYSGVGNEIMTAPPETSEVTVYINETYSTYSFTEQDELFLGDCLFIGDSICKGLAFYGVTSMSHTFGLGGVAARNIYDFTFDPGDGSEVTLNELITLKSQPNIVFTMGMNDVNITTPSVYAKNYKKLLENTQAIAPDSELFVFSITPVLHDSEFTENEKIDACNKALREMIEEEQNEKWHFIDISPELKNELNALKTYYSSGDGIHITQDAYYAVLWQFCQQRNN